MTCRQALNIGYLPSAADYLTRPVANDNYRRQMPDWVAGALGIGSCCVAQLVWATFLISQLSAY